MRNVRIWFKKVDSAKYISHLDLARCMGRVLKISGLPVWYTEGFNPRIHMVFAMPLSLGISGEREMMDIRLTEDSPLPAIPERMNRSLPADLCVFHAAEPQDAFEEIRFADYEIFLEAGDGSLLEEKLRELFSRDSVTVVKHTKKGEKELEICPYFRNMQMGTTPEGVAISLRLPCGGEKNINPNLLIDALKKYEGEEPYAQITRKRLLKEDFSEIQ